MGYCFHRLYETFYVQLVFGRSIKMRKNVTNWDRKEILASFSDVIAT